MSSTQFFLYFFLISIKLHYQKHYYIIKPNLHHQNPFQYRWERIYNQSKKKKPYLFAEDILIDTVSVGCAPKIRPEFVIPGRERKRMTKPNTFEPALKLKARTWKHLILKQFINSPNKDRCYFLSRHKVPGNNNKKSASVTKNNPFGILNPQQQEHDITA